LCPVLVGRTVEWARLTGAVEAATAGAGSTILLSGEAGVGKSRLVRDLRQHCVDLGGIALVGRAVDTATALPFRPVAEALLAAYRMSAVGDAPDVAPFRGALSRVVPDGDADEVAAGQDVSLLHVAEGFLRVVRNLARPECAAVVLFEDMHWADAETLAVLEYLADNVTTEPVLIVATARPDGNADAVAALRTLADRRAVVPLRLRRLTVDQTVEMTRRCLGDATVPAEVLHLVSNRADGLPFFVEELLAGFASDGALAAGGGGWVAHRPELGRLPATFVESVRRRFSSLPAVAQRLLMDAALLGRRIDPVLLAAVGEVDADRVDDVLLAASEMTLTVIDEFGARFRHALTRDALIAFLPPRERALRAKRALDLLLEARPELPGELTEVAADLAETAGDVTTAADLLLRVGRRSLSQGALTSAESALRRALRFADGPLGLDVTESLVEILALAGSVAEAFELGETLLARLGDAASTVDPDGRRRAAVHLALARSAVASSDWPLATAHLDRAHEFGAPADLTLGTRIDALRATVALGEYRFDDAEKLAAAAIDAAERTDAPDLLCEALLVHGRCLGYRELGAAERAFDRARVVARDAGLAHRQARALAELGIVDFDRCAGPERLLSALHLARACGAVETESVVEQCLAFLAWTHADVDAVQAHAGALIGLARRYRLGLMLPWGQILLAGAHALRGDADAMEPLLAEAAPQVVDDPSGIVSIHGADRAVCALAHDDLTTASRELAIAFTIARTQRVALMPMLAMDILMRTIAGDDTVADAAMMRAMNYDIQQLLAAELSAADAVRLGQAGDAPAATDAMRQTLDLMRPTWFLTAVTMRLVAPCAAADGWGEPTSWLTEAESIFEAHHLTEPAEACRTLLRRLGGGQRRQQSGDAITPRERDVLVLLAEGLPNKTIAERLFLSPRTVEKYVERLLMKTSSANRAQLATYAVRHGVR
jgi:DNA-binding NarL/FixJ family response regulator